MAQTHDWDALLRQGPPREIPHSLRAIALRGRRQFQVGLVLGTVVCVFMAAVFFPWPIVDDIRLHFAGVQGRGVVIDSIYANRTVGDTSLCESGTYS